MPYYPKSQIKTNLYTYGTYGNDLVIKQTQDPYSGYYYATSDGRYFTGKTPQDGPNIELEISKLKIDVSSNPIPDPYNSFSTRDPKTLKEVSDYKYSTEDFPIPIPNSPDVPLSLNKFEVEKFYIEENSNRLFLPFYSPTIPTQKDYQIGEFRRYFCKKTNEITYLEINKDTYDKLLNQDKSILWQFYTPFNIPWKLTGDIEQVNKINKNMVQLFSVKLKLPKFEDYLGKDYTKYYKETV